MFNHLPRYRFFIIFISIAIILITEIFMLPFMLKAEDINSLYFGITCLIFTFIILSILIILKYYVYKRLFFNKVKKEFHLYNNSNSELFNALDDVINTCSKKHRDCIIYIHRNFISIDCTENSFCYYFDNHHYPSITPIEMTIFMNKIIEKYDKNSYNVSYKYKGNPDLWSGEYIDIRFNFNIFKNWKE